MNDLQLARELFHLLHETEFGPVADPLAVGVLPMPRPLTRSETRLKNAAAERLANHLTGELDGSANAAGGSA